MANNNSSSSSGRSNDRLSYGLVILIFGVLFLLDKMDILDQIPYANNLISIGAFFLIAGFVFLLTQPKRVMGWIFLGVGILLNANVFFSWMSSYSNLIVPAGLIIAGTAMILTSKKKN
ncbi:hypothetical protein [Dysgonomonas sp. 511]|uniref:LiaF transmembrane domain-containing protein n=1 Tax=Dysgonomonas sp. 511 TaxID=2302930 RepID=UPI0013D84822|nr:hypothetical protein [Dysgonomonas sp. 511]NDV77728.1 hypothetical protein [Dysgonomonas sp. 511]